MVLAAHTQGPGEPPVRVSWVSVTEVYCSSQGALKIPFSKNEEPVQSIVIVADAYSTAALKVTPVEVFTMDEFPRDVEPVQYGTIPDTPPEREPPTPVRCDPSPKKAVAVMDELGADTPPEPRKVPLDAVSPALRVAEPALIP